MTLLEEAIERMLEAERDVCRLVSTNFNRHPQARDEYNAAVERRERFKTAIVEAYGQIESKYLQLANLAPPAVPIICAGCRKPIERDWLLGSTCDCARGLADER